MERHTNIPHKVNPQPKDNSTSNTSPRAKEISRSDPKIPYVVSHKEVNEFRIIIRAYVRNIGELCITPLLP
jgi:hypothetical protein